MQVTIRLANLPQDYPAIAAVLEDENPGGGESAEELAYADATQEVHHHHATLVAQVTELEPAATPYLVGVAFVGHDTLAHQVGKFVINLRVRPDWQGRRVGKALYRAVGEHLQPFSPQELVTSVWHAHPRAARFLSERGFVEAWRRVDWQLDVTAFDSAPYAGLAERLQAAGIIIKTYADLAHDAQRLTKLHELDWALWQSIPFGQPVTKRSLEQFTAQEVDHPKFIAEACFIALAGQEFVGYSNLSAIAQGYNTEMTGVLPGYRGHGIASLLKLYGIRYAQEHGAGQIDTQNDSINEGMIALNQKLGFMQTGAQLRFVKNIS